MKKKCSHFFTADRTYKDEMSLHKCAFCDTWQATFYEGMTAIYHTKKYDLPYMLEKLGERYKELLKRDQGYLYVSMLELKDI